MMPHVDPLLDAQIVLATAIDAAREQGSSLRALQVLKHALAHLARAQLLLGLHSDPSHVPDRVLPSGQTKVNELAADPQRRRLT